MGLCGIRPFGFYFNICFNFDITDCPSSVSYTRQLGLGICMLCIFSMIDHICVLCIKEQQSFYSSRSILMAI